MKGEKIYSLFIKLYINIADSFAFIDFLKICIIGLIKLKKMSFHFYKNANTENYFFFHYTYLIICHTASFNFKQ